MNSPIRKVTVAICTWNRCEALRDTLEHFTRLKVREDLDWELLVVNNCCTDATDEVVSSFQNRLPIRVLHEGYPGLSYARNLVVREANGSHIAWTDDDVLVDPDWLEALLQAFERYQADWAFGASSPKWPGKPPSWYSSRFQGYFAILDYGPDPFIVTNGDQSFFGLNFAGTREAHIALHGFRTEFGFRGNEGGIGEDVDMFERALRSGMRIVYTPHARVRHVIPPARVRKRYHRHRQWVANQVYYRYVDEIFPKVRYLFGLPRFFYSEAARDVLGYARSLIRGTQSDRFYHELQILRFVKLSAEAARHGFKRPARTATAVGQTNDAGPVRP